MSLTPNERVECGPVVHHMRTRVMLTEWRQHGVASSSADHQASYEVSRPRAETADRALVRGAVATVSGSLRVSPWVYWMWRRSRQEAAA